MESNKYMLLRYNISVDDVREEMNSRNILSRFHEEILDRVKKSSPYKKLKEISLNQFINVEAQSDSEDVKAATAKKLDAANVGLLALSVDNVLRREIKESLKSIPYSLMEDIVASIASRKHPEPSNKRDITQKETASESSGNSFVSCDSPSEMIKDKHFLQSLHRLLAGSTASLACVKQHVDEIVVADDCRADITEKKLEQKEADFNSEEDAFIKKIKKDDLFSIPESNEHSKAIQNLENIFDSEDSDKDLDLLIETNSNCSADSIHTSDLSTYDDTISISSEDEEILGKKHISVKEATEICYGTPVASDSKNMGHSSSFEKLTKIKSEAERAENISPSSESPRKELPQRKRKQNPKYSSEDILSYSQIFPKKIKK
ncbi:uncharacterized protein LOC129227824 [Uloborus diversus]|uniref:uncharacterized protein LOC129227824 n=1 Tax=Uloborus diversus TaxID=327109 RepID=UPI0024095A78|nr:uncharacterized protein LOC129227824 [Uloborus diversus]